MLEHPLVTASTIAVTTRGSTRGSKKKLRQKDVAAQKLPKSEPTKARATDRPR